MPAFMFEWYLNEFHNKQIAKVLDGTVTIAAFIIPVGSLAQGVKILTVLNATISGINVALMSKKAQDIVKSSLSEKDLANYNKFAFLWTVAESPFQDIILDSYISSTTQFFVAWNAFKATDRYNYLLNQSASKEAIILLNSLISDISPILEEE